LSILPKLFIACLTPTTSQVVLTGMRVTSFAYLIL